jgi:hypothetical protein
MKKLRVIDVARPVTTDIDPNGRIDVAIIDSLVRRCAANVTEALKQPPHGYSELQAGHVVWIFDALRFTHVTIRNLLTGGSSSPGSVDALALARLQLETLYSICLMVQDPSFADVYVKSFWRDTYVRFLLEREERKGLPRFDDYVNRQGVLLLEHLRCMSGATDDEKATIEHEELGIPLPHGAKLARIRRFPQPMGVIEEVSDPSRKQMLERLYPEYRHLCSFAHGTAQSSMFKLLLYERWHYRDLFTEEQRQDIFQRHVAESSLLYSSLSVIQCACEMVALYPCDVELRRTLIEAWNVLLNVNLLCRTVWEIRTKALLGVIS